MRPADDAVRGLLLDLWRVLEVRVGNQKQRWYSVLRRSAMAANMRGSNTIEGYEVSADDSLAAADEETSPFESSAENYRAVGCCRDAMNYAIGLADDKHFRFDATQRHDGCRRDTRSSPARRRRTVRRRRRKARPTPSAVRRAESDRPAPSREVRKPRPVRARRESGADRHAAMRDRDLLDLELPVTGGWCATLRRSPWWNRADLAWIARDLEG